MEKKKNKIQINFTSFSVLQNDNSKKKEIDKEETQTLTETRRRRVSKRAELKFQDKVATPSLRRSKNYLYTR